MAQHRDVIDRSVVGADGGVASVRGHDADATLRRLAALRDAAGAPWLNGAELAAASRLRSDWEAAERGMVRGSDWAAPPMSGTRGGGNGREAALAAHCDAKRRSAEALDRLAPPLRRVVERVCLREEGLEMLERAEAWPARSGKIALKLALSQLAAGQAAARASLWMRLIIEKSPLERCAVSASPRPKRSNMARGSTASISAGVRPENTRISMATSPRTKCASESPRK